MIHPEAYAMHKYGKKIYFFFRKAYVLMQQNTE